MKGLIAIIDTMTADEKQDFLLHLNRKNRRSDVKNVKLFKLIDSGIIDDLDVKIYGKPSRNSFHALCKRLQDCLIDFLASDSFAGETSEEMEILKLLLASRIFFERKEFKVAFKTLVKAEKAAVHIDGYSILNEIYHTKIQYAHLNNTWNLTNLIKNAKINMEFYQQDFQLNQAYAIIKSELKSNEDVSISNIVTNAFSHFNLEINEALTYKSLFQLMEITTSAAKLKSDFYSISPFMMNLYQIMERKKSVKEKYRYYHINILYLLAVTRFRNKEFNHSKELVKQMELSMNEDKRKYYKRFEEKLITIKALNFNYTGGSERAIRLLSSLKNDSLNVELLKAMCLFQQGYFSDVYSIVKNLNHSDIWYEKKMGWIWVLKKNLIEILTLTELDQLDLVLLRLQQFKRKFTKQLQVKGETRVLTFLKLISRYYENPEQVVSNLFKEEVENSFDWLGKEQEDIFVMSFFAWLKSKMERKNLYDVTLELVGQKMT